MYSGTFYMIKLMRSSSSLLCC